MFFLFYFIIQTIIISCEETPEEKKIIAFGKVSACMAINHEITNLEKINKNSSDIYSGLANCYYKITKEQVQQVIHLIRKGFKHFKGTSFEKLVDGKKFEEENSNEERIAKLLELQAILQELQDKQTGIKRNETKKSSSNYTKEFISELLRKKMDEIKMNLTKGINKGKDMINNNMKSNLFSKSKSQDIDNKNNGFYNFIMFFVNMIFNIYVIGFLCIIFLFFGLRFLSQLCSDKNKKNEKKSLKKNQ